jgi:hypothetical protein
VAVGDFNQDGKPDLAVDNKYNNTVSVLLNTTPTGATTLSFAPQQTFATGPGSGPVAVADFNGDGKPDLAVGEGFNVSVLLNTTPAGATAPSFAPQQSFPVVGGSQSLSVGDFNGDGKPDLAFPSNDTPVSVLPNTTPTGATALSFAPQQTFASGSAIRSVVVGDFNGDGKPDLAFVHSVYDGTVSVLLNTTSQVTVNGSPATGTISSAPEAPASITVAAGNHQTATVNTAFATNLAVDVRDAGGTLVQNVSVTLTAPAGGATGHFGSSSSVTVVTNASGRATAPTFVANASAGSYTVTAQAAGGGNPSTSFSLTNTRPGLTITGTSGDDTITVHNLAGNPAFAEVLVNGQSVYTGAWSGLGGITIAATSGNDTINVENAAAGTPIAVDLGTGADVVNLSPVAHTLGNLLAAVSVNGGGVDTLNVNDQATAAAQSWTVTGNSVTRGGAGPVNYANVSSLVVNGGDGDNTYIVTGTSASLGTTLNTGGGADTVTVQAAANPLTVNSAFGSGADAITLGSATNVLSGITAPVTVTATATDTLALNDQGFGWARTFSVTAATVAWGGPAVSYSGLGALTVNGGTGADTFTVASVSSTAALTVAGGGGNNTLVGPETATAWNITAANAGTLTFHGSTAAFSGIKNLKGGAAPDTFVVSDGAGVSGTLDGGGSSNTLDYSAYTTAVTVNLQTSVRNIQSLMGGSGVNTLVGPNTATVWILTAQNTGTLTGGISFAGFQNLTGGAGNDTFVFAAGAGVDGTIDGGGGTNKLDYAAHTGNVIVNLQTATATGVGGGVANIQNVTGGTGPGGYNILVGSGGNVFVGGSGRRNLLIAGAAAGALIGGSDQNILIAGTTDYDTNPAALQDIMGVWTGPGSYADRVNRLVDDPTYAFSLNPGTVLSNGGGNTLTGKPAGSTALDLYFAALADMTDATGSDTTVGIS